jgi:cellulose synthase A
MLCVAAHGSGGDEADEVEDHHTGGGLRERVTMGSHLNDHHVIFFGPLYALFCSG